MEKCNRQQMFISFSTMKSLDPAQESTRLIHFPKLYIVQCSDTALHLASTKT